MTGSTVAHKFLIFSVSESQKHRRKIHKKYLHVFARSWFAATRSISTWVWSPPKIFWINSSQTKTSKVKKILLCPTLPDMRKTLISSKASKTSPASSFFFCKLNISMEDWWNDTDMGKPESLWRKSVPVLIFQTQNLNELTWNPNSSFTH